jgi:oligopeptide/dipeptide ABC transporter ATP-binding protein
VDDLPLLVAEHVTKTFRLKRRSRDVLARRPPLSLRALDDVSISLRRGQVLGVVGESGSGKSTLARALVRLIDVDQGRIALGDVDLRAAHGKALRRLRPRIQLVYQDPYSSLNPRMTVGAAIAEPARVHGLIGRGAEDQFVADLLERVGLQHRDAARYPRQLSGGQRQRVAIARALALNPEILIADEPVSALDVSVQAQILNLLSDLQEELDLAILFITHQLAVVSHLATELAVMYLGQIVETGPRRSVFGAPRHPYTIGLLEAQPSIFGPRTSRAPALRGELPSPLALPSGCRFRTRCKLAQPICHEVEPPAVEVAPGHYSRCHVLAPVPSTPPATLAP